MSETAAHRALRADHVGSLLRPSRLHEARASVALGRMTRRQLRTVEDECIRQAVRMQEEIGLPVVTDGEYRRSVWWADFIERMPGARIGAPDASAAFVGAAYVPRTVETVGRIGHARILMERDFTFLAGVCRSPVKVTIPSPSRIHFHGGRDAIDAAVYPDLEEFWADIVRFYAVEIEGLERLGCRYVQIDDPVIGYFLEERMREKLRARGEDPDAVLARYVDTLNQIVRHRRPDTVAALHVCRGNARNAFAASGGYAPLAEAVLARLEFDRLLLEYDDERSGDFAPLAQVPRDRHVVLGLVSTKRGEVEDKDALKRRLDEAGRHFPLERCALSPQCGFASTVEGNTLSPETQSAKLRLVVEVAREFWGGNAGPAT